jgi:hypothetical protein
VRRLPAAASLALRHVLTHVLSYIEQRWDVQPPQIALLGTSMGGQGALRRSRLSVLQRHGRQGDRLPCRTIGTGTAARVGPRPQAAGIGVAERGLAPLPLASGCGKRGICSGACPLSATDQRQNAAENGDRHRAARLNPCVRAECGHRASPRFRLPCAVALALFQFCSYGSDGLPSPSKYGSDLEVQPTRSIGKRH